MKTIIFILISVLSFKTMAYGCPAYTESSPQVLKTLNFIKPHAGVFQLGRCRVEIVTCNGSEDVETSTPLAEIYIQEDSGREVYTTITYPVAKSKQFFTKTKIGKRILHFEKTDKMYEDEFGRTEVSRLELIVDPSDSSILKRIELGIYSTNKALNSLNGNKSEWFICENNI